VKKEEEEERINKRREREQLQPWLVEVTQLAW
jgi:hypothetical protein